MVRSGAFIPRHLESSSELPWPLFAAEPPDHTHGRRGLVFAEHTLLIGEKDRHIGPIAPILVLHFKSICQCEVIRGCDFLQRLGHSAEEPAAVGEVLSATGEVRPRRELILSPSGAAVGVQLELRIDLVPALAHRR